MSNEWLSPTLAHSEKLVECYVDPEMTWTPKKLRYPSAIHDFPEDTKLPLLQFQDIFRHIGTENKRILVEGTANFLSLKNSGEHMCSGT